MATRQLAPSGTVTTTALINNIHCASCLTYIEEILAALRLVPVSITANYVSHELTIIHPPEYSENQIFRALSDAAFEVRSVRTENEFGRIVYERHEEAAQTLSQRAPTPSSCQSTGLLRDVHSQLNKKHMERCLVCQISNEKDASKGFVVPIPEAPKFAASLSIRGMTCAACILSINEGVQQLEFLEDVSVSLLTHSATVTFSGQKDNINLIVERIEDRGFDCHIEDITEVGGREEDGQNERTVMIKIAGMFCDHCPEHVLEALLASFPGLLKIDKAASLEDPIIKMAYCPQQGVITLRDILATVHNVDSQYKASIYHPPTIEERSRAMQLHERRRLLLRLLLSFIVAIPTFLIGVVWMSLVPYTNRLRRVFEEKMWVGADTRAEWALFFLATPVMFFAADIFHVRAVQEIRALWGRNSKVPILRRFYRFGSMNLLMSAGTSIAYFPSIAVLVLNGRKTGQSVQTSTYFDTVVFLTMFILAGRYLEAYSKAKASDAVTLLGKLKPTDALLVGSNPDSADSSPETQSTISTVNIEKINVDLLEVGDVVRVPHGTSPPADGTIVLGESTFDESSLTGESRPITKRVGDQVFVGTINTRQPINVRVTGVSGASMLDQIVRVVREGQTKRAPVERIADTITGYFVPVITLIAILTFIIWFGLGQSGVLPMSWRNVDTGGWAFWAMQFAIAVFVGACPCGIALAAPTALFVGSGLAAQHGILVKGGGEAFQEASALDVVVFDKTGTLTEGGNPKVTDHAIITSDKEETKIVWAIAQALEESSSHPIAKAIATLCTEQDRAALSNSTMEELPGRGLKGKFTIHTSTVDYRHEAAIGSEAFISSLDTPIDASWSDLASTWKSAGKSIALLALRPLSLSDENEAPFKLAALFATTDPLRAEACSVITTLREQGLSIWMISGDNTTTATAIGHQVGIPSTNIIAGVLPAEKADKIRWLQSTAPKRNGEIGRAIVAMVGDGINDALALTAADAGIAIGSGSDVAISSAKFVLVSSNLQSLITLITLSRAVFQRVKFNFAWALVYNVVLLPIAAGVIYPVRGHPRLNPVWASLAMALSSLSVISSSLILRTRLPIIGFRAVRKVE
ncbi:Cu2+-exporting ATPase [Acephala macrosclerotiorum]|nr:Cu2+-exporting ATPase [Acephala macrosclerotiorum]